MSIVHSACLCLCNMSLFMLHVHVHVAHPCPFCMSVFMLHVSVHAVSPCLFSLFNVVFFRFPAREREGAKKAPAPTSAGSIANWSNGSSAHKKPLLLVQAVAQPIVYWSRVPEPWYIFTELWKVKKLCMLIFNLSGRLHSKGGIFLCLQSFFPHV